MVEQYAVMDSIALHVDVIKNQHVQLRRALMNKEKADVLFRLRIMVAVVLNQQLKEDKAACLKEAEMGLE
jgi:hypothetical protein